ncbi:MAG: CysS/YqeB C-terminal domain-containing protein [Acidimicrobiales bacterium]
MPDEDPRPVLPRLVVLMGSGETAPTMVKTHRAILQRLDLAPEHAVLLDTPYGFQENADDITARALDYFAASVGHEITPARLRRAEGADALAWERAMAQIAAAGWVFSGPGSPTYALAQWKGSDLPRLLADKTQHGGATVFASAAALTLGRYTVPVYEIYKAGVDPVWIEGLDLLAGLGPVAVIPHFDNAEGGNHDTRFCYLGERRLRMLEAQLPDAGWVLGVDEHTAAIVNLGASTLAVEGRGVVTVRHQGQATPLPAGETITLDDLLALALGNGKKGGPPSNPSPPTEPASAGGEPAAPNAVNPPHAAPGPALAPTPFHEEIRRLEAAFDASISARDADGAVRSILELDDVTAAWSGDTTQSDAPERARAATRRMVVALGALAGKPGADESEIIGPYVQGLLAERATAREEGRYEAADRIRDVLLRAGLEIQDTPQGVTWRPHGASEG